MEIQFIACYDQEGPLKWNRVPISKLKGANVNMGWIARKKHCPFAAIRTRIYALIEQNRGSVADREKLDLTFYKLTGTRIIRITESFNHARHHMPPDSIDQKASIEGALIIDLITHDENSDD
jgi:hypothetical protein